MNVLVVTNNLYPKLNANSEIAYRLGRELKNRYGQKVTILGFCDCIHEKRENQYGLPYGLNEYEIKYIGVARTILSSHDSRFKKLLKLLVHPSSLLYFIRCTIDKNHTMANEYVRAIRKIFSKQDFECIICVKNPNDTLEGVIAANIKAPIIAYELDPWESDTLTLEELRNFQYNIEKHCAAIITTNLLYHTYFDWKIPIEQVYRAEFPNIVRYAERNTNLFHDGNIHCVFTGQLYGDIRNPQYTIELFSKLPHNIILDIFGNDNGCLKGMQLPQNVIYHGSVDSNTASAYIQSADILVNIGNTLLNQMPSKILTYISMGKPILNIIKSTECPTLEYMKKYPLSLNLIETETVEDSAADSVCSFCKDSIGKRIDFAWIEENYKTATPEYVGSLLNDVITKCVADRKE